MLNWLIFMLCIILANLISAAILMVVSMSLFMQKWIMKKACSSIGTVFEDEDSDAERVP